MGHLIDPKTWDRNCRNFGDFWAVRDSPEIGWAVCVRNYAWVFIR